MYWGIPTVIPLIALVCYGALLFITGRQGLKKAVNRFFALYLLSMLVWSFGAFMMYVDAPNALFWNKVMLSGLLGMPVALFGFARAFLLVEGQVWWLYLGYTSSLVLLVINAQGYLTDYVYFAENGGIRYQFGPAVPLFGIYSAFFIGFAVLSLIRGYRQTRDSIQRNRIRYGLLGVGAIVLGSATNIFPALGAYPIDIAANVINALLLAYAIFRYQLLDITVVVRRGLLYSIPTAIIGAAYFLVVFLAVNLFHIVMGYQVFLLSLALAAVTAVAVQPLWSEMQSWIDRLFFREKYDSSLMLQRLSRTAASVLDLPRLTDMILDEVTNTMHISKAGILLKEETSEFRLVAQRGIAPVSGLRLRGDHPVVRWLARGERVLTRDDVDTLPQFRALWRREREDLERMGTELFIPLKAKGELVGIFAVGPKLSQETYSQDDQLTLTTLANQTAVAIQNARLWYGTKRRLQESTILLEVGRALASVLALEELLQMIIDSAVETIEPAESGVIHLLDDAIGELYPKALAGKPPGVIGEERMLIGKGIAGYALEQGKVINVPEVDADPRFITLEGHQEFKSLLVAPLLAEGRRIGTISINSRQIGAFTQDDQRLLMILAAHAATAVKNAQLFARSEELAIAQERNRIAREIHDGLAQNLASLLMQIDFCLGLIDSDPQATKAILAKAKAFVRENVQEIRRSIFALRPLDVEKLGFLPALHKYAQGFEEQNEVPVHLSIVGEEVQSQLPPKYEYALFRIVQEALNNVRKHANAKNVWIGLDLSAPNVVSLTIRDDGVGFDREVERMASLRGGGFGIRGMKERTKALGGKLVVEAEPGSDTKITAILPLRKRG